MDIGAQRVKAPSARISFCLKTEIFFYSSAYGPHVSSADGPQKRMFLNALQCGDF